MGFPLGLLDDGSWAVMGWNLSPDVMPFFLVGFGLLQFVSTLLNKVLTQFCALYTCEESVQVGRKVNLISMFD